MELAKTMKRDPRECVNAFFARLATAAGEYREAFDDEVESLVQRVRKRAVERQKEAEEKAKKERLGPGGLDPLEVLESLPPRIKQAFETQDTPLLKQAFAELPPEQAKYHFDRVVQSGLWVPAKGRLWRWRGWGRASLRVLSFSPFAEDTPDDAENADADDDDDDDEEEEAQEAEAKEAGAESKPAANGSA